MQQFMPSIVAEYEDERSTAQNTRPLGQQLLRYAGIGLLIAISTWSLIVLTSTR